MKPLRGIITARHGIFKSEDLLRQTIDLYEAGDSFTSIGKKLGCATNSVRDVLFNNGIESRGRFDNNGKDYTRYDCNDNYFETIDTEEKAYWLGYLYADGCNHGLKGAVSLSQCESQKDAVYKFAKAIEAANPLRIKPAGRTFVIDRMCDVQAIYELRVTSKKMCQDLSKLGCVPKKTLITTFPELPKELQKHFIRGYFDGDGSFTQHKDKVTDTCFSAAGTLEFLKGMQSILVEDAKLSATKISRGKEKDKIYVLRYCGTELFRKFYNFCYKDATIYLDVKKEKVDGFINRIIERDGQRIKVQKELEEKVLSLRDAGKTFKEIGIELNMNRDTISKIFKNIN